MPDRFIIDITQATYDWIFDRTGILKGQLVQASIIIFIAVRFGIDPPGLLGLLFPLMICFAMCGINNMMQRKRVYNKINAQAERCCGSYYCLFWRGVGIGTMLIALFSIREQVWTFALSIILLLFAYLMCVKVRDREPPESSFFNFNPTGA